METTFKEKEGYPSYLIGSDGSVFSKKSKRFLKPILQHTGYKHIELFNEEGSKQFLVHRLVAMAFVPNPNNYPIINHKDQNKTWSGVHISTTLIMAIARKGRAVESIIIQKNSCEIERI